MTTIERNPDIDLDKEKVPDGMALVEGKCLMQTARSRNIPFGVAYESDKRSSRKRPITIGLIIRNEHLALFNEALEKKLSSKRSK